MGSYRFDGKGAVPRHIMMLRNAWGASKGGTFKTPEMRVNESMKRIKERLKVIKEEKECVHVSS